MSGDTGPQRPGGGGARYAVDGLASPRPFAARLPEVYADGEFGGRFVAAFDDVLAPVFAVLDCLDAYWDPRLAPADFLAWLAGWVAADAMAGQPVERLRLAVGEAVRVHRLRGTVPGLTEQLRLLGVEAEVTDNGGAHWSATPNGPLPGSPRQSLLVRVAVPAAEGDPTALLRRAEALVEEHRPAHVGYRVEAAQP
ncbi:phage tail protein [Kitasatospora indigofera]|uniref:phage tail protein n=1 Tax=Kitasatospora indigofera TaxID=67307 RepID=UPI0033A9C7BF